MMKVAINLQHKAKLEEHMKNPVEEIAINLQFKVRSEKNVIPVIYSGLLNTISLTGCCYIANR
jgi:hypothetical protein